MTDFEQWLLTEEGRNIEAAWRDDRITDYAALKAVYEAATRQQAERIAELEESINRSDACGDYAACACARSSDGHCMFCLKLKDKHCDYQRLEETRAQLTAKEAECEQQRKFAQSYYGEGMKGWTEFCKAEREITQMRAALKLADEAMEKIVDGLSMPGLHLTASRLGPYIHKEMIEPPQVVELCSEARAALAPFLKGEKPDAR